MISYSNALLAMAIATAFCVYAWDAGSAQDRAYDHAYITVKSRYDNSETVSAPVRRLPNGRAEVKLPNGPWVDCGTSCYDTLRVRVLDFWNLNERGP